ncbi:MAG: ATPase [Pseudomonadota bacterium]
MKFLVPEPSEYLEKTTHKAFSQDSTAEVPVQNQKFSKRSTAMPDDSHAVGEPPVAPKTLEDVGFENVFMRDILIKTMYRTNVELLSNLSKILCLLPTVTQELIDLARAQNYVETVGTTTATGTAGSELRYQLTDAGRQKAADALVQSEYYGAMPVPLSAFIEQSQKQQISTITVSRNNLTEAMRGLVVDPTMVDEIGPAVNSGRSILLYGPPGNGKSTLANAIRDAVGEKIYVPRFLEYSGQVISLYDPVIHENAELSQNDPNALRIANGNFDSRYVLSKRPTVLTGGELTFDMLDLTYSPESKVYQAPLQLKATGGIFIVDDLGRQSEPPQKMINRLITPMETGEDILGFISGEKFLVPYDVMTVFSTNFHPNKLFDKAALRRIAYKILIDSPNRDQMLQIYMLYARAVGLEFTDEVAIHLFTELYPRVDNNYAAFHAKFLIDQMFSMAEYNGTRATITIPMMNKAWQHLHVKDHEFDS